MLPFDVPRIRVQPSFIESHEAASSNCPVGLTRRWQKGCNGTPTLEQTMTHLSNLSPALCDIAKWAFTTRRVDRSDVRGISTSMVNAKARDLILFEIAEIGHHKKIQPADRRVSESNPGDCVVLCLGNATRRAKFLASAVIDDDLTDLAAGADVAGRVDGAHVFMQDPTRPKPLGLLTGPRGVLRDRSGCGTRRGGLCHA